MFVYCLLDVFVLLDVVMVGFLWLFCVSVDVFFWFCGICILGMIYGNYVLYVVYLVVGGRE